MAQAQTKKVQGELPSWNLKDFYESLDDPKIKKDLETARRAAEDFAAKYKGKVASINSAEFGRAIAAYESLQESLGKVLSYAYLYFAEDMGNSKAGAFLQNAQEASTDISAHMLFFTLEINRLSEEQVQEKLTDASARNYDSWVRDVRVFAPYQLSQEQEELLHEKRVTGKSAWVRLFDETFAGLRFNVDGEEMSSSAVLNLLSSKDAKVREKASKAFTKVLNENKCLFALITNTLAKDKQIEDKRRGLKNPMASRHLDNLVEEEVVEALSDAVKSAYPKLSHRYYKLKAQMMGQEVLNHWDRNAPLPNMDDGGISWDDAKARVLKAYNDFSPTVSNIAQDFFDKNWIDAKLRPSKDSGAFSHPTVPSVHPYILVNYHGKIRDVMTLAHELGHGVHQVLASPQGYLKSSTPLTLAETASVFGEMLTFQSILKDEADLEKRRLITANKVEDMLNTVVRQIAFYEFEKAIHTERQKGELSVERLGEIWMEKQSESLGSSINLGEGYENYWSYIPHFIHSPFYVYAYAFGDCLVNSLYAVYQESPNGFEAKYLDLLRAGGTLRHKELLAPFGLDASDPKFWNKGLSMIEGFIDQIDS